jgi:hypothetical protein
MSYSADLTVYYNTTGINIKRKTGSNTQYLVDNNYANSYFSDGTSFPQWVYYDFAITNSETITDLTAGMTATASSDAGSGFEASKAIDDNTSTAWSSSGSGQPCWLKVDFGAGNAKTINSYSIRARSSFEGRAPKDFTLQGSNDDSTWTDLDVESGIWGYSTYPTLYFSRFSKGKNTTAYRYYRLYITSNFDNSYTQIAELQLAETDLYATHGYAVAQYTITAPSGGNNVYAPKNFTFEGSDDGTNWTVLDTQTNQSFTSNETKTYNAFVNNTVYRAYRINVSANTSGAYLGIAEMELMYSMSESATIVDTLTLADDFQLQTNPDNQDISDTLTLSDVWDLISTYEPLNLSDILTLTDSWDLQLNPDNQSIADTLSLSDDWVTLDTPKLQSITDSLTLSDSYSFYQIMRKLMRLDLRWHELFLHGINLSLSWLLAKKINIDLRWLRTVKSSFNTDLRWLTNPYSVFTPINPGDFQILINGTDILLGNDIDVQSGNIVHTVGQKSQATFVLARKHDDLNRTHSGVASQITNNNPVQIYIDGHLEFDGTITELNLNSETETISVLAQMEQPVDNRHSISLPLPSVNEKIHPYHCLVNNAQIDNPLEDTRAVIIGSNGWYWTGSAWNFFIENAMTFGSDAAAQSYVDSYVDNTVTKIFDIKKPSVTSREKNPPYYKGVKINLGTKIVQQLDKYKDLEYIIDGKGHWASEIEAGTFIPKPNYSYFWAVLAHNVRNGQRNGDYRYIGTSLGSVATDLWVLDGVTPSYQKIKPNIVTELGYYYIGEAPYKEVSAKNGQLIPSQKWQDRNDGLYNVLDASYNFTDYAKTIANLEYQKLLNINGNVLPITGSSIEITFDAYYFYNVKLLTRINVTNTTVANTFNNTNGFPVSVKSVNINFKTMKITLATDNRLSQIELDEIESMKPDENSSAYVYPESAVRVYHKFDLKTWSYVS